LNLFEFFSDFGDLIVQFGGHAQAAGIQVLPENMPAFQKKLREKAETIQWSEAVKDELCISSEECSIEKIEELEKLRPYGHGFDAPVFEVTQLKVTGTQVLKNQYPKWSLFHPSCLLEAISFSLPKESIEKKLDRLTGTLSINQYMSVKKAQILVSSFKESD